MREVVTDKGTVTYLNSGDWVEHLTCLEFYNSAWHLYKYDEKAFAAAPVVSMEKNYRY